MKPEELNLKQAAAELNIDVPIMAIRALKEGGFELHLYGGRKVKYNPKKKAQQPAPSPEPTVPPSPKAATSAQRQAAATPKAGDAGEPDPGTTPSAGDAAQPKPAQQPEPQPQPSKAAQPQESLTTPLNPPILGSKWGEANGMELESLTVKELRKLAGQAGIANASRLTKEQLIQSLSGLYSELDEIARKKDI